jgi:hypothetical protein
VWSPARCECVRVRVKERNEVEGLGGGDDWGRVL